MTRQERRKRRRQRRRRMQAGILLSLVLVLGLIIALRAGKERETLEPEIPLAAERQKLTYIAPAPALPDTAAEETPEEPEEPPVEPEPENRYAELHFSDEDVYILACLVYHEARGESFEGQVAVVEVVLNRMLSDYFPDTVEEVVFQKYGDVWQFSPAPYLYSAEPDKEQYLAVHTAIEEREHILSEDSGFRLPHTRNALALVDLGLALCGLASFRLLFLNVLLLIDTMLADVAAGLGIISAALVRVELPPALHASNNMLFHGMSNSLLFFRSADL